MFKRTKVCSGLMLAFGGTLAGSVAPAFAQQQLERVEITGSSIKRIDAETALPVTVVTREEIARSGAINMEQLTQRVAAVASTGNTTGSQLAGLATYGLSSISLRGLGEQRTLVLVNGRRLAVFAGGGTGTGGGVDINAIPVSAIERVEILRDGASAIYGSDAVAGVVNFILRKDYDGLEATAYYGRPGQSGGGESTRGNFLFGKGDLSKDNYNVMVGVDLEKSRALFAKDRDYSKTGNQPPFFQSAATETGRIEGVYDLTKTPSQNLRNATTNPFGITGSGFGNPNAPDRCADINMFSSGKGGVGGAFDNCKFDSAPYVGLFPTVERTSLVGSLKVQVSPDIQVFGEAMYSKTKTTEAYQPSPVRNAFLTTDLLFGPSNVVASVPPVLLVHPSNPAYQSIVLPYLNSHGLAAMAALNLPVAVTLRTFLTGPRTEFDTNDQTRFVGGVQGTFKGWDYDIAASLNQQKTSGQVIDGYFSQFQLASVLNNPANNWNPWASGGVQPPAIDAQLQAAKYNGPTVSGKSTSNAIEATATSAVGALPGGDMQLAVGGVFRKENLTVEVPAILGSGDIAGLGGATAAADNSRKAAAVFSEINMPVMKGLEINASGRFDKYSVVGTSTNGKLSARWTPTSSVLLRGAIGTGFRAPTLVELYQPNTLGSTEQFIDPAFPADGAIQPNATIGGNTALKPERSRQGSVGVVFSPIKNLTASADFYVISIKDYIIKPAALALVNAQRAGTPLFGPVDVTFNPDGTVDTVNQTLRNAASALTNGIDINVNWTDTYEFGKVTVDLSGTYVNKFDLKTLAGVEQNVGTIVQTLPDGSAVPLTNAAVGVVTRWKHNLSGTWSNGPWRVTLAQNYYSGYRDANDLNGNEHTVPAQALYDAQVGFSGVKSLNLTLGVRNLFDKQPPIFIGNGASFQFGYDPQMYDPRGRFIYVTANYKFW